LSKVTRSTVPSPHIVEGDAQHRLLLRELGGALLDLVFHPFGRLGALREHVIFRRQLRAWFRG
jgi:hypothetical protein